MEVVLDCLIGTWLKSINRRPTDTVLTFSDRSVIVSFVPIHLQYGGEPREKGLEIEAFSEKTSDPESTSLRVSGITFTPHSSALRLHFNDQWTLRIDSVRPTPLTWLASTSSDRVVGAGCGRLRILERNESDPFFFF